MTFVCCRLEENIIRIVVLQSGAVINSLGTIKVLLLVFKCIYRVGQKTDNFLKCITFLHNDIERHSIYQNVQLSNRSKSDILNAAVFKYSLHKVRETILH